MRYSKRLWKRYRNRLWSSILRWRNYAKRFKRKYRLILYIRWKNRKVLIPIDVSKIGDINKLLGILTEEISHGKDALEGIQDKKVAEDETNKEKGLESLGRPTNDYVKNKLGEDNNSKIKLSTDGIDLTNADVGEKVGDSDFVLETVATTGTGMVTGISAPVVAGIAVAGGIVYYNIFMPEEEKEQLKREISQIYENTKEGFSSILDKEDFKDLVIAVIKSELKERGIEADVKIDKDGNVIYTLSPLPEDMKKPKIPPFPLPDKKIFQIPPMIPPKQETQKERWEREERAKREEQEFFNELQKLNGIPILKEEPVNIIKSQVKPGDVLETPDNAKDKNKFRKGKNEGDSGYENLEDGSWWERDVAGDRAHSGSGSWKRWPKKPDRRHKKKDPDRRTINNEGKVLRR